MLHAGISKNLKCFGQGVSTKGGAVEIVELTNGPTVIKLYCTSLKILIQVLNIHPINVKKKPSCSIM